MRLWDLFGLSNEKLRALCNDNEYLDKMRSDMEASGNDFDSHRIHAHGQIDMRLDADLITPDQANELKYEWDKKHGY